MCYMKLNMYEKSFKDASKAIKLQPKFLKSHLRKINSTLSIQVGKTPMDS